MPGSPIRTPWDHSLVDSSPRPIAASHVLHRLLVPRHPPFALDNLTTENKDARVHCAILNQQPTHNPNDPLPNLGAVAGSLKWYRRPGHAWIVLKQQPPVPQDHTIVLSGPNRVLIIFHQPHRPSRSVPTRRPAVLGSVGRCRRKLASVSACEHPTTTSGQCGLLSRFHGIVAP